MTIHTHLKTISVLVGLSLIGMGAAQADQLQDIMSRKELKCGTFSDVPPFAAPDAKTREMVGFDVDMCNAIAKRLGVTAKITPLSVEARVPEVKLGRVDVTIANLAYTLGRAEQIQFSDPYYLAKEMLAVKASDPGKTKADFKGKRIASTKGSNILPCSPKSTKRWSLWTRPVKSTSSGISGLAPTPNSRWCVPIKSCR